MRTVTLVVGCVSSESLLVSLPTDWMVHHPVFFIAYIYVTLLFSNNSSQQAAMTSWSGDDDSLGSASWTEQNPNFKDNFPLQEKRDFKSMRDVRSYAPNQPVNWPRCAHGDFCVMQVYQGWNNSGRRFWHCPRAWVSKAVWHFSIIFWFY